MINKICVLSGYYPSKNDPHFAFVGTLISAIADMGIECHVISPVSSIERKHRAHSRIETTKKGSRIFVYCPRFFGFPSRNSIKSTYWLNVCSIRRAIKKTFENKIGHCDAIYSHFLFSGINAAWLSEITGIPAFVAVGESSLERTKLCRSLFGNDLHEHINGVISVSSELRKELRQESVFSEKTPIEVFPNSIDPDVFKPLDRESYRKQLGIEKDDFIISFVGGFIQRKGFDKLQEAVSRHPNWKCILIGTGELEIALPDDQVVFSGRVSHDRIPEYICASDIFVLPTQAEGCCNAIVEAMGCGLPIVSSDRSFNDDILDETNSIRIDPDSVDAIEQAIVQLEQNKDLRKNLATGALKKGQSLSIMNRAAKIVDFMEKNL